LEQAGTWIIFEGCTMVSVSRAFVRQTLTHPSAPEAAMTRPSSVLSKATTETDFPEAQKSLRVAKRRDSGFQEDFAALGWCVE
jgi:hypothetical protein